MAIDYVYLSQILLCRLLFFVIRLEAWLTNSLTVNLLKSIKQKENLLFCSKYQIYFIS